MFPPTDLSAVSRAAAKHDGLSLLVLFGSRARDDAREDSDWDFAYTSTAPIDPLALRRDIASALGTDNLDLACLSGGSALLRYRVARDGTPVLERPPGEFARFWMNAVQFWCEVAPLVRAGHDEILAGLSG